MTAAAGTQTEGEAKLRVMSVRAWAGAARRMALRHIAVSVVLAVGVALAVAAGVVGATAGGSATPAHRPDPRGPAFTLSDLASPSGHVSLSAYAGHPVIVNFFASWCAPCRKETPLLAAFYRSAHGAVPVIGIDTNDSKTAALSFTRSSGVSYPVGFDPAAATAGAYGVSGIPQTFFLDAQHRVVDRVYGAVTHAQLTKGVALMDGTGHTAGTAARARSGGS